MALNIITVDLTETISLDFNGSLRMVFNGNDGFRKFFYFNSSFNGIPATSCVFCRAKNRVVIFLSALRPRVLH